MFQRTTLQGQAGLSHELCNMSRRMKSADSFVCLFCFWDSEVTGTESVHSLGNNPFRFPKCGMHILNVILRTHREGTGNFSAFIYRTVL